jgi:histidine ammonia-lyase
MMAHVTAAALTSEMKTLAHPAAADSIPTSAGREDHVSMSMWAAIKAWRAVELATEVVAIELLAAAQAIDLLAPLRTSPPLEAVHKVVRAAVPRLDADRPPSPDVAALARLIATGAIEGACGESLA